MLRSQSDSSPRKDLVDQPSYHYASEGHHYPSKRVGRLFYDPERVTGMDRVFSEYDWHTHTFSPTLRDRSPPQHNSPCFLQDAPSDATVISKDRDAWKTKRAQSQVSRVVPKPPSSQVPDETLVSTYLLSTSNSTASSSPPDRRSTDDDTWLSDVYSTSPILHAESFQSPLQQSIMAYAELDRACAAQPFHPPVCARAAKQLQERRDGQIQSTCRHSERKHYSTSVNKGEVSSGAEAATEAGIEKTALVQRNQLPTCVSDASFRGLPRLERDAPRPAPPPLQWPQVLEHVDNRPKRRSSAPERRPHLLIPSKVRSSSESRSYRNRRNDQSETHVYNHGYPHPGESPPLEEDEEEKREESSPKEASRLAVLVSALHYQYVSVGMRIQLAMHRAEKKVARRLSDKQRKQKSTDSYATGL